MATISRRTVTANGSKPGRTAPATNKATAKASSYQLRISRLTVDKLGVKLYDKASAVVAELISNGYDADAETVTVRLPLNRQLASQAGGKLKDLGYMIEVEDNGHGMTPMRQSTSICELVPTAVCARRKMAPGRVPRSGPSWVARASGNLHLSGFVAVSKCGPPVGPKQTTVIPSLTSSWTSTKSSRMMTRRFLSKPVAKTAAGVRSLEPASG